MKRVLIVEDNDEYRNLLASEIKKEGYIVDETSSPIKGLEYVARVRYDAVISDLNLPYMSGVLFTEAVKNISPKTACVILTGDPDEESEIMSINNNIDLYVEKNKTISVILKYLEKLIAEYSSLGGKEVILRSRTENIELNVNDHSITKNNKEIELTPKEYEILRIFLANKNKVISREEFLEMAWDEQYLDIDPRLVDNHIKKLRDKIKSISIVTVRGYGYRWNEIE